MRFGFFDIPGHHPILVTGNTNSRYSFWDLQRLEEGFENNGNNSFNEDAPILPKGKGRGRGRPANSRSGTAISALPDLTREQSLVSNTSSGKPGNVSSDHQHHQANPVTTARGTSISTPSNVPAERKFNIGDPYMAIKAHKSITVPKMSFTCRQIAWSNCGKWCVAVGEMSMVVIFKRWD